MIATLKKFKYLIITVVVLVIAFVVYTVYTADSPNMDSATLQRTTVDGSGNIVSVPSSGSNIPDNDLAKSFVDQLLVIRGIELKTKFFEDPVFLGLVDNHRGINAQLIGRPNPFAPIGKDIGPEPTNYQDINGSVIQSTTGVPLTEGSNSDSVSNFTINPSNLDGTNSNTGTSSSPLSTTTSTTSRSSSTSTKSR
jgi:hypothetical protein